MDENKDGIIWVSKISDPKMFGVIKVDEKGVITDFVEKPQTFVSDLAIIGIYYMKDGAYLRSEMQYLIDNNIKEKGEFQLTNALENMKKQGTKFYPGKVDEWLDCGNKDATVYTNQRVLEMHKSEMKVPASAKIENAMVIQPCFIGENAILKNAVIGPHVSVGANTSIESSSVSNSIIQTHCKIKNVVISNSMIGNFAIYQREAEDLSLGDYVTIQ